MFKLTYASIVKPLEAILEKLKTLQEQKKAEITANNTKIAELNSKNAAAENEAAQAKATQEKIAALLG